MSKALRLSPRKWRASGVGIVIGLVAGAALVGGYLLYQRVRFPGLRLIHLRQFLSDPEAHSAWAVHAGDRCAEAAFLMPTDGLIGFMWGDAFYPGHRHQGLDIFGPAGLGQTPVVAAYDGYLTRLPEWRSAIILRVPEDPLNPDRQIWLYYAHMADPQGNSLIVPQFPPGSYEVFVRAGTLIGYQGNYSADPNNPTGIHLHFSIVLDDGSGSWRNELKIANTLDPSPYLGMQLEAKAAGDAIPACAEQSD